jgi:hypothetical protein
MKIVYSWETALCTLWSLTELDTRAANQYSKGYAETYPQATYLALVRVSKGLKLPPQLTSDTGRA